MLKKQNVNGFVSRLVSSTVNGVTIKGGQEFPISRRADSIIIVVDKYRITKIRRIFRA